MGRLKIVITVSFFILIINSACFRESTVEQAPTTTTQTTQENSQSLATGTEALGEIGDFSLESANIQIAINGNLEDVDRSWFLEKNAGSIFDISTRFESTINRQLFSRNDDGINQLTQGVNMNRRTLVSYDSVTVNPIDRNIATLVMTGKVFDMDGSLEAAGAIVDSQTRVVANCEVETILEVRNDIPNPNNAELDFIVFFLSMTTVVRNTGDTPLPIYTVNDIVVTPYQSYQTFVPYPDWGFAIPDRQPGQHAYPPYLQLQPRQLSTAHYGFTSRIDGVLMTDREILPDDGMDINYVGKISRSDRTLAAGDAMTFVRECFAVNGANSASNSFISIENTYGSFIDLLQLAPMEEDTYARVGVLSMSTITNFDQDGTLTVEYIDGDLRYYNGSGYVPLEDGRTFPIFGSSPIFTRYNNIRVPPGTYRILAKMTNGDAIIQDSFTTTTTNDDGETVTVENAILVPENDTLSLAGLTVSSSLHAVLRTRTIDQDGRIIFSRGTLSTADGANNIIFGQFPDNSQGRMFYSNMVTENTILLPEGDYILSMGHGPRFSLNSPTINVGTRIPDPDAPEQFIFSAEPSMIDYTLTEQVPLDGYLSADFDARTDNDPLGQVNVQDMIHFAHAEDIDVFFAADSRNLSEVELEYRIIALGLGPFSQEDLSNNVNSFFDEVAVSNAIATLGRSYQAPKKLGRFAMFNLPRDDAEQTFTVPAFESDPAGFYDRVREENANVVIQISRPRNPSGLEAGFFTAMAEIAGLPAGTPIPGDSSVYQTTAQTGSMTRWIDFDLLQLLSGNRYEEYLLSRQDWFGLLNAGIFKPVTGGSLPSETKDIALGTVRTYIATPNTALRDNELAEFWDAAKAGNSFTTNGPVIEANINGSSYGETTTQSGTVTLDLKVSAADWIPVDEVRIVVDGVVQDIAISLNQESVVRYEGQIQLELAPGSHWVVIEAGAALNTLTDGQDPGRQFWRAYPGHKPVAFTNPIFIQ